MDFLYAEWLRTLRQDGAVAVATVVNGIGAVPRENGAQMLIKKSGGIFETIGGGKLEANAMQRAKKVLTTGQSALYHFDLTGKDVAEMEMICGGKGDIFIFYSSEKDMDTLQEILGMENQDGWMCFPVDGGQISFISQDGTLVGDADEIAKIAGIERNKDIFITAAENNRYMVHWIQTSGKLHILGAGHVSLDIAKVARIAGIDCYVYDDRAALLTKERFAFANCVVLNDMQNLPDITVGSKDMIAIVTRGHLHDKECLEWALSKDAGYIGMIGSKRKINMIYERLIEEGFSKEKLSQVYAPIGLDIGAQTPAEIAVAIVAELIAFKRL